MNQIEQKLVLRDIPLAFWMAAVLAAVFAAYSYLQAPEQWIPPVIGGVICLAIILLTSVLTVTADKATGLLTLCHTSLLRRRVREIPIADITGIVVERSRSQSRGRSSMNYRIAVQTRDGGTIPFRSYYSGGGITQESKARRLREFLGVGGGMDRSLTGMYQQAGSQASQEYRMEQETITGNQDEVHMTDNVQWTLTTRATGGQPVSVWHSPDFQWEGAFLYLAQKVPGQRSSGGVMGLVGGMLLKTSMSLYGFSGEMAPGMEKAAQLSPLDPKVEPYFFAYTNDPAGARQILSPWTFLPLADWAQKHPLRTMSMGSIDQLAVLYGPQGVSIAMLGLINPDFLDELTHLGVELVKSQGGGKQKSL